MEKTKKSAIEKAMFIFIFVFFALYTLSIIIPFAWLLFNTLKGSEEYYLGQFFPQGFSTTLYRIGIQKSLHKIFDSSMAIDLPSNRDV